MATLRIIIIIILLTALCLLAFASCTFDMHAEGLGIGYTIDSPPTWSPHEHPHTTPSHRPNQTPYPDPCR